MKYTIEKCPNGYILEGIFGDSETIQKYIFEELETDQYGYHALVSLFWFLTTDLAPQSKHNEERIIMEVDKK